MTAILYSFRRCPYAMRGRFGLLLADVEVELREISLRNKPEAMLAVSPKGTVPVLVHGGGHVIDESREILRWALHDKSNAPVLSPDAEQLIDRCDGEFKGWLDKYKYAVRYPDHPPEYYRGQALPFLEELERRLTSTEYLNGGDVSELDVAVFPFVRQFAKTDDAFFAALSYDGLKRWRTALEESEIFARIMTKYPLWVPGEPGIRFPPARS